MKSSLSFCFVVTICTVVALLARQTDAKKGCNAFGQTCYGGHGKRSLAAYMANSGNGGTAGTGLNSNNNNNMAAANVERNELDELHSLVQALPKQAPLLSDTYDARPQYQLINIMKSLLNGHPRRLDDRFSEVDYIASAEGFNRDTSAK